MDAINRILQLVEESGLTAKEYALNAGLGAGNITDWKTGRSKPSIESLQKIAKYANVSINWILGSSFFRNEIDRAEHLGTATATLLTLNKSECSLLELNINYALQSDEKHSPYDAINSTIQHFPENRSGEITKTFCILYFDYCENKELYKLVYGSDKFSVISFLEYCKNQFSNNKYSQINKQLQNKINELKGISKELTSKILHTTNFHMCPVYGQIAAGQPNWAEECLEGYLPLDPQMMNITNPEECFFLRVNGESMNKEIKNGAYALIRKTDFVENGEIAVVLVDKYDATLKKFTQQGDLIILEPMSTDPSFTTQVYGKDTEIKILGKYIGKMEMK